MNQWMLKELEMKIRKSILKEMHFNNRIKVDHQLDMKMCQNTNNVAVFSCCSVSFDLKDQKVMYR